ncbi:MAG: amidohydrolase family protein [Deltaproteobacteria bacterium]
MRAVAREARARGLGIHTHASENAGEIEAVREASGLDNVSFLRELGCVGHDTVLAHCVWLTSEEQKILRETGTHVAHCPSSNLKLASAEACVALLRARRTQRPPPRGRSSRRPRSPRRTGRAGTG